MIVEAMKALDPDCLWWHPVEIEIWQDGKSIPLRYKYQESRRDINDGWLFRLADHREENGKDLETVLKQISDTPGSYRVEFKSGILTVVYEITTQVPVGYENTEEKPTEMIIKTVKLEGTGLQKYLNCRKLDRIGRIRVDGKSQTIFDFFQRYSRPELVYSGSIN